MQEVQTWSELQELYPNQWILVVDCEWGEGSDQIASGRVIGRARTGREFEALEKFVKEHEFSHADLIAVGDPPNCLLRCFEDPEIDFAFSSFHWNSPYEILYQGLFVLSAGGFIANYFLVGPWWAYLILGILILVSGVNSLWYWKEGPGTSVSLFGEQNRLEIAYTPKPYSATTISLRLEDIGDLTIFKVRTDGSPGTEQVGFFLDFAGDETAVLPLRKWNFNEIDQLSVILQECMNALPEEKRHIIRRPLHELLKIYGLDIGPEISPIARAA